MGQTRNRKQQVSHPARGGLDRDNEERLHRRVERGFGAQGWNITANMICAAATGKSICTGDSGGPLIAPENGRQAVVRYLKEMPGDLQLILLTPR